MSSGPDSAKALSEAVEGLRALHPGRIRSPLLLVDPEARSAGKASELKGSGVLAERRPLLEGDALDFEEESSFFLMARRSTLLDWWNQGERSRSLTELVGFPEGDSLCVVHETEPGVPSTFRQVEPAPFTPMNQTFRQILFGEPRINWDQLAVAPLRFRDGDPYLWGGKEGTIWISLDGNRSQKDPRLELVVRFIGEGKQESRLILESPALAEPCLITQEERKPKLELDLEGMEETYHFYGSQWLPLHVTFEGPMNYESGFEYPKIYMFDEIRLSGFSLID